MKVDLPLTTSGDYAWRHNLFIIYALDLYRASSLYFLLIEVYNTGFSVASRESRRPIQLLLAAVDVALERGATENK